MSLNLGFGFVEAEPFVEFALKRRCINSDSLIGSTDDELNLSVDTARMETS